MARRIIRTSSYNAPSTRTVVRRKDGKLTARQKWLNGLGKKGMFEWEVSIKQDGVVRTKTLRFDTIDDARAWSYNRCQPGQTYFIDGLEVVSR
tara:strand:- start:202 stop:480 length:279 start_codon:yes stop_codon:yes gene_type:complete